MPIKDGDKTYPTFASCIAAKRRDGEDPLSARKICGELEKRTGGNRSASTSSSSSSNLAIPYEGDNNRIYLKVWLIDGSVNRNRWGVTPQSIPQNINTAIGKPLIIYKNTGHEPDAYRRRVGAYDHPYLAGADSIAHALAYQDLFRVGTFIDVFESPTTKHEWWGVAEVTDEDAKRAIREDKNLPLYVSPMIHLQDHNEPEDAHSKWSFIHSSIVGEPAYGALKASISGQCSGAKETCLLQLRKAAIEHNHGDVVGCGFCKYKAMKEIQMQTRQASSVSSLDKIEPNLQTRYSIMSEQNNNPNNDPNSNQDNNQQNKEDQQQQQQQQAPEQFTQEHQKGQKRTTNPQTGAETQFQSTELGDNDQAEESAKVNNKQSKQNKGKDQDLAEAIARLGAEKKSLELQLEQARADVQSHKALNEQFNVRLAKLEQERDSERATIRQEQITTYVNQAPAYRLLSASERQQQIETFVKGSMSVDEIRNIIEPLNASVAKQYNNFPARQASLNNRSRPLQLGANTGRSIEVRQASDSNTGPTNDGDLPFFMELPSAMFKRTGGHE